jgi:hypothetical protein
MNLDQEHWVAMLKDPWSDLPSCCAPITELRARINRIYAEGVWGKEDALTTKSVLDRVMDLHEFEWSKGLMAFKAELDRIIESYSTLAIP